MWVCLCIFVYIWMTSSGSGSQRHEPFFWLEFLLDSRLSYESLEGLTDFLAFLVTKLWPNFRKIIKEIPTDPRENSWNIWNSFGITFEPEMLEKRSRAQDSHRCLESKKLWATNSAHWIGRWRHEKNLKTDSNHDPVDPKPQTQKLWFFNAKLQDFTSL